MKNLARKFEALIISMVLVFVLPVAGVEAAETKETKVISGVPVEMSEEDTTNNLESADESADAQDLSDLTDESLDTQGATVLTEQTVYNKIIAQKANYPEGMAWTNANPKGGYLFQGYISKNLYMTGYGCAAIAYMLSDIAFGTLPAVDHHNWKNVRVGDVLRINDDTHSVIVLKVDGDYATVAEGNYNSSIHWGRVIKLSDYSSSNKNYVTTRWGSVTTSTSKAKSTTTTVTTETAQLKSSSGINVSYRTHIQNSGWESLWRQNGAVSGTVGSGLRLEGIVISVSGDSKLGIQYTTHCQDYGWMPWTSNGDLSGTEGEGKRLEAIKIQLTGADKDKYDVYYRVHAQNIGWLNWATDGEVAGTEGYGYRLEAIQIVVLKKGVKISSGVGGVTSVNGEACVAKGRMLTDVNGEASTNVAYRTHVQNVGWQGWKYNGAFSGTQGRGLRLEGINIKLTNAQYSGGITYRTHIQNIGWENEWKTNGAMSGTSGLGLRLEAIQINLTGEMAKHYDVYYRVHAQNFGWLGWAENGAASGTAGYGYRLEGIQIVLVPKGEAAPAANYGGVNSSNSRSYVER
jgi:uncharacterized protein YjdB